MTSGAVSEEKKLPGIPVKASFDRAESGMPGHHGQVGLVLIAEFSNETDVRIGLQHVGQAFDFLAGRFIQSAAFGGGGGASVRRRD